MHKNKHYKKNNLKESCQYNMSCLKKEYKNWNTGTSFSKKLVIDKDVTVNKDIAENLIVYLQKIESTLDQNIRTNIKPFMKLLYFRTERDYKTCFL